MSLETDLVPGMGKTSSPCACTHASDSCAGLHPFVAADGGVSSCMSGAIKQHRTRYFGQRLRACCHVCGEVVCSEARVAAASVSGGQLRRLHRAGQQPAAQGRVRYDADAELSRAGDDFRGVSAEAARAAAARPASSASLVPMLHSSCSALTGAIAWKRLSSDGVTSLRPMCLMSPSLCK
jgi:hypothetical protein